MPTTSNSSDPALILDSMMDGPRVFMAITTAVSSAIVSTGYWQGYGAGSRGGTPVGMRVGDVLLHQQTTNTAYPGRVTWHSVIASTANVASTAASSGWNASYNVTLNNSTST